MKDVSEQIKNLELLLLDPDIRKSKPKLNDLLCDDFIEIGQSGTIYNKADMIAALTADPHTKAQFSNFDIRFLADGRVLAKYTSRNRATVQRYSLWEKQAGAWRILYHEAERTNG